LHSAQLESDTIVIVTLGMIAVVLFPAGCVTFEEGVIAAGCWKKRKNTPKPRITPIAMYIASGMSIISFSLPGPLVGGSDLTDSIFFHSRMILLGTKHL